MKKKYPEEEYPLYEIVIDDYDNTGIRLLSIVAEPAIEMMGMAFDNEQKVREFEFKEVKDKQMIVGPAMIPDKKIMRKDDDGNPYMVVFSKETISQMVSKFNANGSNRRINVDHSKQMVNAFVMENWIVEDPYYDKAKLYGFDVPVGTWMVCVKVEDDEFWKDEVRGSGKYGFSIEGLMGQKASKMSKEEFYESVELEKVVDDLSEDEILEMFNSVAREADESFVLEFMTEKGRRLSGTQKFVDAGDITIPQPQMYWTYVGPNDDKTRPFCKHMLELDKYWTDDDLNEMTDRLGYDFQQYFGSYNCRHTLKRVFITGKPSEPTKGEKKSLVNDQRESGLLGFMKEFTKRRECFGCPPSGDGKNADGSKDQRCRGGKESGADGKPPSLIPGTPEYIEKVSKAKSKGKIDGANDKISKEAEQLKKEAADYQDHLQKTTDDIREMMLGKTIKLDPDESGNIIDMITNDAFGVGVAATRADKIKAAAKHIRQTAAEGIPGEGAAHREHPTKRGTIIVSDGYGDDFLEIDGVNHTAKHINKRWGGPQGTNSVGKAQKKRNKDYAASWMQKHPFNKDGVYIGSGDDGYGYKLGDQAY